MVSIWDLPDHPDPAFAVVMTASKKAAFFLDKWRQLQEKQPPTTPCMRVRHEELAWQAAPLCQLHEPT